MTIGSVQLLVIGFDEPDLTGAPFGAELDRLRADRTVRVLDRAGRAAGCP